MFSQPSSTQSTFVKEGIVEYGEKGETRLSSEASDIYRVMQPKPVLKGISTTSNQDEPISVINEETFLNVSTNKFVAGTLEVSDNTELLRPIQSHVIVGIENPNNDTIEGFAMLTSEKGLKTSSIIKGSTTVKLSNNQPISGENKGQYVRPVSPPLEIKKEDFIEHSEATAYVNNPDIQQKLGDIQAKTSKFQSIPYSTTGITLEDLNDIKDIKNTMHNTTSTEDKNTKHEEVD